VIACTDPLLPSSAASSGGQTHSELTTLFIELPDRPTPTMSSVRSFICANRNGSMRVRLRDEMRSKALEPAYKGRGAAAEYRCPPISCDDLD
jgi:hypothetical protein